MANHPFANEANTETIPDPFPGEYRLQRILGKGTYGTVWLAEQLNLESRLVAIKTIHVSLASPKGPGVLASLRKDAAALAKIKHPNVVQVYDLRLSDGHPYLILNFVDGGSLLELMRRNRGSIGWRKAARYLADVGEALVEAHTLELIHRDIKPENILLDARRDEALLADFGVSAHLNEQGTRAGTPLYMAPEAWDGDVSPALDVFSLAVTFYHLSTGKFPFSALTTDDRNEQIRQGLPDPDPNCDMPEPLERVLRAGLTFDPTHRPDLGRFVADLRSELNKALADTLIDPVPASEPDGLRLLLSRQIEPGIFRPIRTSPPKRIGATRELSKNMKAVLPTPERVQLFTGDRIRVEVVTHRDGHVTVFCVGPTGELSLLYPNRPSAPMPPALKAGRSIPIVEVEMTPPTGRERLFAIWSRGPLRLDEIILAGAPTSPDVSGPYRATREMARVQEAIQTLPPDEYHAVVLELDHVASR